MSHDGQKQSKPDQGRQKKKRRKGMRIEDRPILEKNAAGTDVGAREMFVAVPLVDVTQIPGVETIALRLFSEVGRDLSKNGLPPHTLPRGWDGARTTTSAAGVRK
jgi:hypothetical protein